MTHWICATIDLDPVSAYLVRRGRAPWPIGESDPVYREGLPRFVELLQAMGITATLFAVGEPLTDAGNAAELALAARSGHEVANHAFSHPVDLAGLDTAALEQEIDRAEEAIARCTGTRPRGFRAPGWSLDRRVLAHLAARGYLYDSSQLPLPLKASLPLWRKLLGQRLPWPLLGEQLRWPRCPTQPYRIDPDRPWCPGAGSLWEVPCGAAGIWPLPLNLSLHHLVGESPARLLERCAPLVPGPLVAILHGLDLVDDQSVHRLALGKPGLDGPLPRRINQVRGFLERVGSSRRWITASRLVEKAAAECD